MWEAVDEAKTHVMHSRHLLKEIKEERLASSEDREEMIDRLNTTLEIYNNHVKVIEQEKQSWMERNQRLDNLITIFEDTVKDNMTLRREFRNAVARFDQQSFRFYGAGAIGAATLVALFLVGVYVVPPVVQWVRGIFV